MLSYEFLSEISIAGDGNAFGFVCHLSALNDLIVLSVGSAVPAIAPQIAAGLGMRLEAVLDAVYRAPACLLAGIDAQKAAGLASYLEQLGLNVAVVASGAAPPRPELFDVAVLLLQPASAGTVSATLAGFIGVDQAEARRLLLTPPGVVLGMVSAATVEALTARLPAESARVIAAAQKTARFALFAPPPDAAQRRALAGRLRPDEQPSGDGLALFGLDRARADELWRALRAPDRVRIVHEAFLTADILLEAGPSDGAPALERLAGVPPDCYGDLLALAPVPIVENVPFAEVEGRLADYAAAGFRVRAELASFAREAVEVVSAPAEALTAAGLGGKRAPCLTPPLLRLAARVLRAELEAAGAQAWSIPA